MLVLDRIDDVRLLESSLYSDSLKLAGTVDCVASFDGVPSIIDFKSSSRLKESYEIESYFMQTAIYARMVKERYGIDIKQLVILMSVEDSRPLLFIENSDKWLRITLQTMLNLTIKKSNIE